MHENHFTSRPHIPIKQARMPRALTVLTALTVASVCVDVTEADIKSNPNFVYSGTVSDLAQQFFNLHADGEVEPSLDININDLPSNVMDRLSDGQSFEKLPGLLQRALLWDSGYVVDGSSSRLVKVYSKCNSTMAEIAVLASQYRWAECTYDLAKCKYKRNDRCNMPQISNVTLCATETVKKTTQTAMWAIGGTAKMLPKPYLMYHNWPELNQGFDNHINAIHTVPGEVPYGECPTEKTNGMIIPCEVYNKTIHTGKYCEPTAGVLVNSWLQDPHGGVKPKFKTVYLVPIILGALVLVGMVAFYIVRRRRRRDQPNVETTADVEAPKDIDGDSAFHAEFLASATPSGTVATCHSHVDTNSSTTHRSTMLHLENTLTSDPRITKLRIPYQGLQFTRAISKGAFGEVWLCHWNSTPLAVKKLLGYKSEAVKEIAGFIAEIQLTASLDHPHIIKLVGVAWSNMENLCMAMEYLPRGDVLTYLKANNDMLSWVRDKLPMALGVARALEYLHSRPTPIIHRDLKAKNVLLTDSLQVKLIDFGVSRDKAMETMTAGVGTPYWSAPEVLDGSRYTEKSDIYSFGVLLSELDNGCVPYQNLRSQATGEPLKTLQILNMIVTGKLRPEFRVDCPARISNLAMRCLNTDSSARPTAVEIENILSGR